MTKPKRITQATLIGERGISLIADIAMSMGLVWYPTGSVEAGIDGHLELRDAETGEMFNAVIGVQSKATDRAFANETDTGLDFYCDERDIGYWLNGNLPVILVVSRPSTREAYWVSIKDYFRDPGRRAAKKVHFQKNADRFDETCRDALFGLATPQDAGVYLAPPHKDELLISNLLPIAFLAPRLYIAPTRLRSPRDVWRMARENDVSIGGEWILRNKTIISFCDLRRPEWGAICDRGAVDDIATEEWSDTDDPDRRREFVDLLNRTLREMVRTDLDFHGRFELWIAKNIGLSRRKRDQRLPWSIVPPGGGFITRHGRGVQAGRAWRGHSPGA